MSKTKVIFVGAGPGDPELITVKGRRALRAADIVIYAGSLVPPAILDLADERAELINSAPLTLLEIFEIYVAAATGGALVVRLHSGDPSIYGAIQEQIDWLVEQGIDYEIIPGVTAAFAAAASLKRELTLPECSQTVVIARVAGRTPVPEGQELAELIKSKPTLCLYLSVDKIAEITPVLAAAYGEDCPGAVVARASRPDELVIEAPVSELAEKTAMRGVTGTAVILVGRVLADKARRSKLYDEGFSHGCRA